MTYRYLIRTVGECTAEDRISVDPEYTVASLAGLVSAHSCGALDIEEVCGFGTLEGYAFAPKNSPALVAIPI